MTRADRFPLDSLIGLCGAAGAGKDACAELLAPFGYVCAAFADALREEVAAAFGIDVRQLTDRVSKETPVPELAIERSTEPGFAIWMAQLEHDLSVPRSARWIMQRWGTEYRRIGHRDYWVDVMRSRIQHARAGGWHRIVVTDVRFPNEAHAIQDLGGTVARVVRPGAGAELAPDTAQHLSEIAAVAPDAAIVHNDGDLEHLRWELARVFAEPEIAA